MRRVSLVLLGFFLACLPLSAEERPPHLLAADLYARGDYADCRGLVNRLIDDYVAGTIKVGVREMATVYVLAACLADLFRDTGWAEAVDEYLRIALEMDPNTDPALAASRTLVQVRFAKIRTEMLEATGPGGRRFSVALVMAADGAGAVVWRKSAFVGFRIGANIAPWLALEGGVNLPLRDPEPDDAELYLGATARSAFALNRPMLVLSVSYVAAHSAEWYHGAAVSAGSEIALRSGVAFRFSADVLRITGASAPDPEPADFAMVTLFGAPITFSLPRITLAAAYSF